MEENKDAAIRLARIVRDGTPPEVKQQYQELLRQMEKGLPQATSSEVLGRRCKF
jgi:hypothetical protein